MSASPELASASSAGGDFSHAPLKRKSSVLPIFMAVAVIAGIGSAIGWWVMQSNRQQLKEQLADKYLIAPRSFNITLREKGELKAAQSTEVQCEVEGRSTIIWLIDEGASVKKGDLLVELASDEIETRIQDQELRESKADMDHQAALTELEIQRDRNRSDIAKGELAVELDELELQKYLEGEWPQQLKDAEIAIQQAEITLERRLEDYRDSLDLAKQGFVTKTVLEEDEFNLRKAQWDLEKARLALVVLQQYTYEATLRQKQSDLEEAHSELERIRKNAEAEERRKEQTVFARQRELEVTREILAKQREQRDKCRIIAPNDGFVIYGAQHGGGRWWDSNDQIRKGAQVTERQVLVTLPDTSQMVVSLQIHEAKMDRLELGEPVKVEIDGIPGEQFSGKVTKIARIASTNNRWLNPDLKEHDTEITLDPTERNLKPGQTAHAEIFVDRVEDALAVPKQSVYARTGQQFVFCWNDGFIEPREVQLGRSNNEWAEVVDGVKSGENILLSLNEDYIRLLPEVDETAAQEGGDWDGQPGAGNAQPGGGKGQQRNGRDGRGGGKPGGGQPGAGGEAAKQAVQPGHTDHSRGKPATSTAEPAKARPAASSS